MRAQPRPWRWAKWPGPAGLDLVHAHDLLDAFVQDVTQRRYETWEALIGYCRLSAMPVGRFVLDVHGEDRAVWPLSDALCAALQVINHLQDCAKDYAAIDRVYLPTANLEAAGIGVEALAEPQGIARIARGDRRPCRADPHAAPAQRAVRRTYPRRAGFPRKWR